MVNNINERLIALEKSQEKNFKDMDTFFIELVSDRDDIESEEISSYLETRRDLDRSNRAAKILIHELMLEIESLKNN